MKNFTAFCILHFIHLRSGMFVVGPESAGAHPGPVCYKKGGPLTVTDANLTLGRLLPDYFPKIFGTNEDQPLDKQATLKEFENLTLDINNFVTAPQNGGKVRRFRIVVYLVLIKRVLGKNVG